METSLMMPALTSEPVEVHPYVSDGLLLRVGGLPLSGADRLKGCRLSADLAQSQSLQRTLSSLAQTLSNSLHTAVNQANGNSALQHALLAIRRSVFNGRRPAGADLALASANLDPQVRATLNRWEETKNEWENHSASAEQRLQQSISEGRKELQQLACHPDFRKGLLLSSPSFERTLEDYVRSNSKQMDRKVRRTERTLLSYLFRTTHKTSPFSTLTPVCLVRFSADAAHPAPCFESREVRCAAKPNVGILSRVAQAITQNVLDYPQLRLTVQDGAEVSGNRVKYWKRTETPVAANGPVHSRVTEHTFTIHLTPSLELLLSSIKERGPMSVADIQDLLTSRLQLTTEEAGQYIRILTENGFLIMAGVRQSIFDGQYWSRFAHELAKMNDPSLNEIAGSVNRIQQQTKEFEKADLPLRPKLLQSVEGEAKQLLQSARSTASVPSPVLYEDSKASDTALLINKNKWREPLSNLATLQRLFSLFDPLLVSKASLKSIFKKRYRSGVCRDILDFSDYFHEVFYRPYQQATADALRKRDHHNPFGRGVLNPLRLPEIAAILDLRADLSAKIQEQLASSAGANEIELSPEWVESIGADMFRRHRLLSNSFFFQAAGSSEKEITAVLNHVYGGMGCMYTRFSHLFAESGQHSLEELLRSNLSALQAPGTLYAEFQGGHETNLNQHGLLADAEIVYPGERPIASPDKQIHVSEITLQYDKEADEVYLFCQRLGRRIVPLYLGLLYPLVLPELQTLFLHFSPPTVLHSELAPKQFPAGRETLSQPRIRYKQVVIERAKWTVHTDALPKRAAQEKDFEYLLRLHHWRSAAGIPIEVFAKFVGADSPEPGSSDERGAVMLPGGGPQKPFFVDFENPFCVSLLEKLMSETNSYLQFTEMLPSSKDAMLTHNGDSYVSECVVEITQSC